MNTASYAARRAKAVSALASWATRLTDDEATLKALRGEITNVSPEIRELLRLEALNELLTNGPDIAKAVDANLPDLTEAEKEEVPLLVANLTADEILQLIGRELREAKPDRPVVTALEKAYMERVKAQTTEE